jgi:hypothetical protein
MLKKLAEKTPAGKQLLPESIRPENILVKNKAGKQERKY